MSLPRKDPSETVYISFDFSNVASSITSPVISVTTSSGTADTNPSAILSGVPSITGAVVSQLVTGGVAGTNYLIKCSATSVAQTFVDATILPVDYVQPM